MEPMIRMEHLSKHYGRKQALSDVSLEIGKGMFGLLGRNGAGKTTLMKILAALTPKSGGELTVCGIPSREAAAIRRITGYLPQEFSMYPSMRVREALDYLGLLSGVDAAARRRRIPALLERVNLADSADVRVKDLSGGMKRRLGIAQAILHDPMLLIVDEPTAGLDPEERIRFRSLLCEIAEDRIVLLSTHIVGDVEAACERVAVLDRGRLLYSGEADSLVRTAEGRVFTARVGRRELDGLRGRVTVTETVARGNAMEVRLLGPAEAMPAGARPEEPSIEDAYLLLAGAEAGGAGTREGGRA